jgi:hypothetical protein
MASPAYVDIPLYQGDRLDVYFRIRDQEWSDALGRYVDGDYVVIPSDSLKGWVKKEKTDTSPLVEFSFIIDDQDDPGTVGGFTATIVPDDSATLEPGDYVYDIQITKDSAHIQTYIAGVITVEGEVTTGV